MTIYNLPELRSALPIFVPRFLSLPGLGIGGYRLADFQSLRITKIWPENELGEKRCHTRCVRHDAACDAYGLDRIRIESGVSGQAPGTEKHNRLDPVTDTARGEAGPKMGISSDPGLVSDKTPSAHILIRH
jgi:hypothetical protein